MARISQLKILEGIPFTADDKIVITFNSLAEQENYFEDFAIETFTNLSFVKGFLGKQVKVNAEIESLYYANYIMFNNSAYGDKWFYAYITGFEYVSDGCTIINFEIDYFQTYMHEIEFKPCFIQRQMCDDRLISQGFRPTFIETTEELPFEIENYIVYDSDDIVFENWKVAIVYKPNLAIENIKGAFSYTSGNLNASNDTVIYKTVANNGIFIANKYYSGASVMFLSIGQNIDTQIQLLVMGGYNILDIIMIPSEFTGNTIAMTMSYTTDNPLFSQPALIDGYTIRNRKTYCSPFCYLEMTNFQGQKTQYSFEYFGSTGGAPILFGIGLSCLPALEGVIYPFNYLKGGKTGLDSYDSGISIGDTVHCMWNENAVAKYINKDFIPDFGKALAGLTTLATGNPVGISMMGDLLDNTYKAMMKGDDNSQNLSKQPTLNLFLNKVGWRAKKYYSVDLYEIDTYFYRCGYQVNTVDIPNILTNSKFNYVKTKNAVVNGDIPIECKKKIQEMLDNGITFWHDKNDIEYTDEDDNAYTGRSLINGRIF